MFNKCNNIKYGKPLLIKSCFGNHKDDFFYYDKNYDLNVMNIKHIEICRQILSKLHTCCQCKMIDIHLEMLLKRYYSQAKNTILSLNMDKVKLSKIIQKHYSVYAINHDYTNFVY